MITSYSLSNSELCKNGTIDSEKVKGKILLCLRGDNGRLEKGFVAANAGAVGMILANDETHGNEVLSDLYILPASFISYADGQSIYSYLNSTK